MPTATASLTGGDAALVAQKSVFLPTPQIPDLPVPPIPLVPNGGGSVALDDESAASASSVPQTASASVVSNPSIMATLMVALSPAADMPLSPATAMSGSIDSVVSVSMSSTLPATRSTSAHAVSIAPISSAGLSAGVPFASGFNDEYTAHSDSVLVDQYHGPATQAAPEFTSPTARALDNFFSKLPDDDQAPTTDTAAADDFATDSYYEEMSLDAEGKLLEA